jgi:conserved oligomeric Golgi complex subunit 6
MTDVANQVFFDTVEAQGRSLLRFLHVGRSQASSRMKTPNIHIGMRTQPPDPDLSPPLALRDLSQVLREIMTVYDSSLLEGEVLDDNKEKDAIGGKGFSRVLDAAVGPALEMCRRMGDMKKETSTWDKGIFLVNCIVHFQVRNSRLCSSINSDWYDNIFQTVFQPFTFATPWVERLDAEIDKYVEELVNEHVRLFDTSKPLRLC